jgi:hypothetical protein
MTSKKIKMAEHSRSDVKFGRNNLQKFFNKRNEVKD